jgi:hypothetical protein
MQAAMRKLLLLLLTIFSVNALAQQPTWQVLPNSVVEKVEVSGIPDTRLTPELRADIQALAGKPYNAEMAKQLADGIQLELPEYIAAATPQPGTQSDRIRLVFVVGKISDSDALKTNINARYIVDAVEVGGKFKAKISDALNKDLQAMVGKNLDTEQAKKLGERIQKDNLPNDLNVERKLRRGTMPDRVKILYDVNQSVNNVGFGANIGAELYHSKQGFGLPKITGRVHHLGLGTVHFEMINEANTLIERQAGGSLGYSLQRDRVTVSFDYSAYRAQWKPNTLEANRLSPASPGLYRLRETLSGSVDADLPRSLKLHGGVRFTELQMDPPRHGYQKANGITASVKQSYGDGFTKDEPGHFFEWNYDIRAGISGLQSDFSYARHQVDAHYIFTHKKTDHVGIWTNFGAITGQAPMFDRFSLGNSQTLRGWTKYEIAPLGGDRVANLTAEYRPIKPVTVFYDMGSVWNSGQAVVVRKSVGFVFWIPTIQIPIAVGFPIRHGNARPTFQVGY